MNIKDTIWITLRSGDCLGIVLGNDKITGEAKAYVDLGSGIDEAADVAWIAKNGAKVEPDAAKRLYRHFQVAV